VASADLLLHPVRLRVLQAFLGGRTLTTGELGAELADVPAASLYRHVARLVDAGVLAVVGERRIRGAVERTYELRAARIGPDQLATMTVDDHRQAFMAFVAGLLGDFDRYLARGDIDLVRDGVTYNMDALWLDDDEYADVLLRVNGILAAHAKNRPVPGRKRRIIASALLRGDEGPQSGAVMTDTQREAATTVLRLARAGRFAEVRDMFAPAVRDLVTAEALRAAWTAEVAAHGQVLDAGPPSSETPSPGLTLVELPLRLERAAVTLLVTMTSTAQLAGLRLAPAGR